jgi:dUTP pyrophosphatase
MASFADSDSTFLRVYNTLKDKCKNGTKNFAILKVAFPNEEIALFYESSIVKHNAAFTNNLHCDSGFDLFVPENAVFDRPCEAKFVDMKIKTEMVYCQYSDDQIFPSPYYLYPRSSLSKTLLIMANHLGIIDSGYRGSVIGAFKWMPSPRTSAAHYAVESGTRLVQICHPSLCPIYVIAVNENDLSETSRGAGGFGSTGL